MSRDTNFYYSFLVLPPRKRRAIVAVWDFCRAVDDAVDEVAPGPDAETRAAAQLEAWRVELEAVLRGCRRRSRRTRTAHHPGAGTAGIHPGVQSAADTVQRPDRRCGHGSLVRPVSNVRCPGGGTAAVSHRRSVSSVWRSSVIEIPERVSMPVNLGMALQLTNIIRDVASDLERGRTYLPTEDLVRFGVTEEALRLGKVTPPVRALTRVRMRPCPRLLPSGVRLLAAHGCAEPGRGGDHGRHLLRDSRANRTRRLRRLPRAHSGAASVPRADRASHLGSRSLLPRS